MSAPCSCPLAGFCERHGLTKSENLRQICINDEAQRAEWDRQKAEKTSRAGQRPSLPRRLANLTRASINHLVRGMPTRTDEQIQEIVEICYTCPTGKFNGSYCETMQCGCQIRTKRWLSKVGWASQHCPDGHW